MKKDLKSQLEDMLKEIPDTYEDFVIGITMCCDTDARKKKIMDFIKNKEDVTTSDVLDFYYDEIRLKKKAERDK